MTEKYTTFLADARSKFYFKFTCTFCCTCMRWRGEVQRKRNCAHFKHVARKDERSGRLDLVCVQWIGFGRCINTIFDFKSLELKIYIPLKLNQFYSKTCVFMFLPI